jgi:hypothetical protein
MAQDGFQAEEMKELYAFSMAVNKQFGGGAKLQQADFIDESGVAQQGSFNPATGEYESSGKSPIAPQAGQADIQKTPSQAGRNIVDFEDTVIGAVGAVQTGTELLKISLSDPSALGKPGAIAKFGNEMLITAIAFGDMAGIELDPQRDLRAFNFDSFNAGPMKQIAIESTAFRAGIYGIAFASAVAEQGTRPTDKDIQQFIDQVGGNSSDPKAFRRTITQFMERQDRRLHTIANVKNIPEQVKQRAFKDWDAAYSEFKSIGQSTAEGVEALEGFWDLPIEQQERLRYLQEQEEK